MLVLGMMVSLGLEQRLFMMYLCKLHIHHRCVQLDTTDSLGWNHTWPRIKSGFKLFHLGICIGQKHKEYFDRPNIDYVYMDSNRGTIKLIMNKTSFQLWCLPDLRTKHSIHTPVYMLQIIVWSLRLTSYCLHLIPGKCHQAAGNCHMFM